MLVVILQTESGVPAFSSYPNDSAALRMHLLLHRAPFHLHVLQNHLALAGQLSSPNHPDGNQIEGEIKWEGSEGGRVGVFRNHNQIIHEKYNK